MAVEKFTSTQLSGRKFPIDDYGKERLFFFDVTPTVAGDATSVAELVKLPFGRVRLLPSKSFVWCDAFGAARVLDFGHRAYTKEGGVDEAEALAAFKAGLDVSAALNASQLANTRKYDIFSRKGVILTAQVKGGTWPAGVKLQGYIAAVTE